jgi:DNA-binding transcriptional MerR regulator
MVGIGAVCEQLGLTPRAIRYYEDQGLVETKRDRQNYRRYDARAREQLQQIAEFRRAGLSLDDIHEIFAVERSSGKAAQRDCALKKLRAHSAELEVQRKNLDAALRRLESEAVVAANGAEPPAKPREMAFAARR